MEQSKIRNIAIIAHVDHGKTTLVDQLFKQSGMFRANQDVEERMMDSMDLERERGITILSKNGSFQYKDHRVNIIDTPGHADFGGQVERVLKMADAALLLVDAAEGPMPQTYFVLKKALALALPVLVVINKIDKPAARCDEVLDEVFDLFVRLNAPDHLLDFPVIYTSAKNGYATTNPAVPEKTMIPLMDMILEKLPPPAGDPDAPLQMLISSISYSSFLGKLGIGKIANGRLAVNQQVAIVKPGRPQLSAKLTKIYHYEGMNQVETAGAAAGEIVAVAGTDEITVGQTLTAPDFPHALEDIKVDPPTISMNFLPNDSPFAGLEGDYVTSRHLRDRLYRETLSDIALVVEDLTNAAGYKVSGRGELHLSILIEKMRREGYEFQVTRPQVIYKMEKGERLEPYEELTVEVDETKMSRIIESMGARKGEMLDMRQENGMARLKYRIPTRGLLGYRSEFMTLSQGMGVMNYVFLDYGPYAGDIKHRWQGVLIAMENCETVAYALFNLQERGRLFLKPGEKVYMGQIVGEHCRDSDLVVNPAKGKKLTNMRAAGSDENVILTPPTILTLEQCIAYINDDELVEVTPKSIRLRKIQLDENARKREKIKSQAMSES